MSQIESPFFSILLPTKNRSHLVGYAIRSVVQQNFDDFELIVCDNDDDVNATREVVEPFLDDERIKYIRTGGLDMVANWNTALDTATGQHITVLEDKMIFYPDALGAIKNDIEKSPSGVVVWKRDVLEDDGEIPCLMQQAIDPEREIYSSEALNCVVTDVMLHWTILPRGLCCTVPKSLIAQIIDQSGKPFYEMVSPDFVSAIKVLANINRYLLAGRVYTMISSNKVSNGKNTSQRKTNDHSYFMGNKKLNIYLDDVYVQSQWIVVNGVIGDYLHLRKQLGGILSQYDVTQRRYFEMLFRELVTTTLAERGMIWQWQEVRQLFFGGSGVLANLYYGLKYLLGLLKNKLKRKWGKQQKNSCIFLNGISDPLFFIEHYLDGKVNIEGRKRFV